MNLPNKLTMLRMILTPVFVACFYIPADFGAGIALLVFILAYITDMVDGMIARKQNLITDFGKLMDPIADKILSAAAFVMLSSVGYISPIATLIVICREFVVSGYRLVAAGGGNVVAASIIGKLKTISQFVGLALLILAMFIAQGTDIAEYAVYVLITGQIIVWISVVLAIWSGIDYVVKISKTITLSK